MSEADGYICPQKMSDGASIREEKVCPDCPLTKNRPKIGLERLLELSTMFNGSTKHFQDVSYAVDTGIGRWTYGQSSQKRRVLPD